MVILQITGPPSSALVQFVSFFHWPSHRDLSRKYAKKQYFHHFGPLHLPGVPGILTFIDKNIKPQIFKLLWLCKNNSAVDNSKKIKAQARNHT